MILTLNQVLNGKETQLTRSDGPERVFSGPFTSVVYDNPRSL